jgi:pimeloyl-ACP methyl ester carboxylesterase
MPTVRLNGVEIYHELHGDGPPLLMIAGLASDSQSWLPVRDSLAAQFRLVLVDNRGSGRSTQDAPLSVELLAADCAALLESLGIARAHVLGHSLGGMAALELAAQRPELVDRLVLAGTGQVSGLGRSVFADLAAARTHGLPAITWFRLLFPWLFRPAFFEDPAAVAKAAELSVEYPWPQRDAAFAAQLAAGLGYHGFRDAAARVRAPTLVLHGSLDRLMPHETAGRAFDAIPGRRLVLLDDAAHALHWDAPGAFVRETLAFLRTGE